VPLKVYFFTRTCDTLDGVYRQKATVVAGDEPNALELLGTFVSNVRGGPEVLKPAYTVATPEWSVDEIDLSTPRVVEFTITS
jgi:hypothetical protein